MYLQNLRHVFTKLWLPASSCYYWWSTGQYISRSCQNQILWGNTLFRTFNTAEMLHNTRGHNVRATYVPVLKTYTVTASNVALEHTQQMFVHLYSISPYATTLPFDTFNIRCRNINTHITFLDFSMSVLVLDCIDSWSLPLFKMCCFQNNILIILST